MAQVIILSDVVSGALYGASRYVGPYALCAQLREHGYSTVVVDYISKNPDLFSYLKNFLGPETLVVGVSSTFLNPPFKSEKNSLSYDLLIQQNRGELLFESGSELLAWSAGLKNLMKTLAPKARLVLGGAKAIGAFSNPQFYKDFDYICIGAGDDSLLNLVRDLESGQEPGAIEKKGLRILKNIQLKTTQGICPDARLGRLDGIQRQESLPIEISRGCIFNCKFCYYEKKASIKKNPEILRSEFIRNYEMFGTTTYHFTDDCFNDHREKVETYCEMFLRLPFKIEWVSYARVDVAVKFPHTIDLMVESGARALFWGIESLNAEVARQAGKGTPTELVKRFLIEFKKEYSDRCLTAGSFITGLPGESFESLRRTKDFLCENDVFDIINVNPLIFSPYNESLDLKVIDYADYSRNPKKYGFEELRINSRPPHYWRHSEMDSYQAHDIAIKMYEEWRRVHHRGPVRSVFNYPHLRTLGFSHEEITRAIRSDEGVDSFLEEGHNRFNRFLKGYFNLLLKSNSAQDSMASKDL